MIVELVDLGTEQVVERWVMDIPPDVGDSVTLEDGTWRPVVNRRFVDHGMRVVLLMGRRGDRLVLCRNLRDDGDVVAEELWKRPDEELPPPGAGSRRPHRPFPVLGGG